MRTKIYIAGKVTGELLHECQQKFGKMQKELERRGFEVINPMNVVTDPHTPWQIAMDMCLKALADCEAIYMLPCSPDSPGAKIELDFAIQNNYTIYHELENVEEYQN